jgi:TonB family protein
MARFPAFATSLAVHSATFAILVVLPVFAPEPLPDTSGSPLPLPVWPIHPRVVLAAARPAGPAPRSVSPRRTPLSAHPFESEPAMPTPTTEPEGLPPEDAEPRPFAGPESASGTSSPGDCCDTGDGLEIGDGSESGGPGGPGDGAPLRIGGDVRPPTKLRHVNPRYPALALQARISGTVEIDCLIDETGRVTGVRVLSGHALLAPAAADAVRLWVYSPTRLNGAAVAVLLTVSVRFEIR